jgi:thiol-disulfide isomerase/thioredoxin
MPSAPPRTQPPRSLTLALALVLAAACHDDSVAPPGGDVLAALALPTVAGTTFDPAPWYQQKVLVLFFSPTCSHCMKELPLAVAAAKRSGAAVLAVLVVGTGEQVAQMPAVDQLSAPVILDDGQLRKRYGIRAVPYTLVLSAGLAKRAFLGEQTQDRLEDALREL